MNKLFAVFALALLASGAASIGVSPCPIQSNIGSLVSGTPRITQPASQSRSS